jgi:uncharacterized membrane protein
VVLAAIRDDYYSVILFVHILAFLVSFAPAIMNPLLANHLKRAGDESAMRSWAEFTAFYTSRIALSGLVVLLVTGVWMVLISDDLIEFSDTWISLAFLVWLAIGGVVSAMILKGEKAMAAGDLAKEVLVTRGGKIATVLTAVMLYLMIFKPGSNL